jgi:hypothetical protein
MSFIRLQIRAAASAIVLFAIASFVLFLLVRGVGNVAAVLPFSRDLPPYSPNGTIGAVLDLRPLVALGAGVLLAVAFVMIVKTAFLDRTVYMLVSMLTLILASSIGIVAGFGGYLFVTEHRVMIPPGVMPAAIAFIVMMGLSIATLDGLRSSLLLRAVLVPVLAVGAPLLLIYGS